MGPGIPIMRDVRVCIVCEKTCMTFKVVFKIFKDLKSING